MKESSMATTEPTPVATDRPKPKKRITLTERVTTLTVATASHLDKVAPRLAARILMWRLLFTPFRTQASTRTKSILDKASTDVDVIEGNEVVHYTWGDGDRRVLLVHGWSSNAGQVASLAQALAAAGFTVVALDLPGHGRSEGKRSSVIHFAKAIEAASDRRGPFYALVAHSLGAAAATYALSRGVQCERAVFFSPVGSYANVWRHAEQRLKVSPKVMGFAVRRAEKWLGITFDHIEPTVLAPRLSCKLLVVHDQYDWETPISDSEALVRSWPDAHLLQGYKLGHSRILSDHGMVRCAVDFVVGLDGSQNVAGQGSGDERSG
jgi:pimeloyl-ACP methyl ester carboxylesterase